ncbi:MAG: PAS domain-containing protein, partial [Alphaproteobacteria bacterium]|nr:PAS domain-containing protein [Alphaproteobacteria bacterium]
RRSERQLATVIDNLPHVLTLKGADRRLLIVNREFEARYGLKAAQVLGKTPEELADSAPPGQLGMPDVRADDLAVLATGRSLTRERRRRGPSGEWWDSIRTKFAVRGPDGTIEGVGTIITDVSELKRAQLQLEQREAELQRNQAALLRMLYDELGGSSPRARIDRILEVAGKTLGVDAVSVWRRDPDAGLVRCLQRWQRRERGRADRALPMTLPLAEIEPLYHTLSDRLVVAFDAERLDPSLADVLGTHYRDQNTTAILAALVRLPDGQQMHVGFGQHDTRRTWSAEDESFARSIAELVRVCLLQEALEQREQALRHNEARIRAIVDNLPHVLTVKDDQRRFTVVNRAFQEWFSVTAEQIIGKTPEELAEIMPMMAGLARPEARALERRVLDTGQPLAVESMRMTATGERRDLMTVRFAVRDGTGAVAGVGLIATDITTLKSAQAELVRRETELRRNQAALLQILRDESIGGTLNERLLRAMALAGETLGADTVSFWIRDGARLRCVERWCRPGARHGVEAFAREESFDGFVEFYRLLRERLVLARDATREQPLVARIHSEYYRGINFTASLAAFIRLAAGQEAHFGLGTFDTPRSWSAEDESFVRSLAELIRVWFLQDTLENRERALQRNQGAIMQALRHELSGGPIGDRIKRILSIAGATLGVDGAALWRIDPSAGKARCAVRWRADHVAWSDADFPHTIPLASVRPFYEALERDIVLALEDHRANPLFAKFLDESWPQINIASSLAAIIQRPGGLQDYVAFSHYGDVRRSWSVEDQSFGRSIAELIGICLFQDEFERREQALRRNHETLIRIVREGLLAGETTQDTLNAIVRIAGSTLDLRRVGVWTCAASVADSDRVCTALWEADRPQPAVPREPVIPAEKVREWFTGDYLIELERDFMVAIEDIETDPRLTESGRAICRETKTGARLNALIQMPDRMAGVVTFLTGPEPRRWSPEDRAFARSVADLTAFVLLSERHRQALAALDLVSQGIYVANARGEVIYANRVARLLAGDATGADVPLQALPAPPDGAGPEAGTDAAVDAVGDVAWQAPGGVPLDLTVARTALPSSAGAVTVIADVTELKRREQERRALEAEMRQAAKLEAVGRLAGGIAHDFNNLLGTVLGFAGFLKEDLPRDSVQHEYAMRIAQASEHAKEVVKQLLAFTRTSDVERHVVDLRKLVSESHELIRAS